MRRQPHQIDSPLHGLNTSLDLRDFVEQNSFQGPIQEVLQTILAGKLVSLMNSRRAHTRLFPELYQIKLEQNPKVDAEDIALWSGLTLAQSQKLLNLAARYELGTFKDADNTVFEFNPKSVSLLADKYTKAPVNNTHTTVRFLENENLGNGIFRISA